MVEPLCESADLARIRFARSPMQELMASMRIGGRVDRMQMHLPWARSVRGAVAGLRLDLLGPLQADPRYVPDFLTPSPERTDTRFADELDRLRATPDAVVREQLDLLGGAAGLPKALLPLYEDPQRQLGRLAAEVQAYWTAAVEPIWPRLAGLLDADMGYRGRAAHVRRDRAAAGQPAPGAGVRAGCTANPVADLADAESARRRRGARRRGGHGGPLY